MTPREPDRFDKQALDIIAAWNRSGGVGLGAAIAAALRAAESSALERAALSIQPAFPHIASQIRALIPPAAALAIPDTCPEEGCVLEENHNGPCDTNMPEPAPAPAAEPRLDNLAAESPAPAAETGKEKGAEARDAEWLRALTHWQEHPRCGVTMEQMFYDARHPKDPYPSERCDGCDPVRLLLTRALRAAPPEGEGT